MNIYVKKTLDKLIICLLSLKYDFKKITMRINVSRQRLLQELGITEDELDEQTLQEAFWHTIVDGLLTPYYQFPECEWDGGYDLRSLQKWMEEIRLTIGKIVNHAQREADKYLFIGTTADVKKLITDIWQQEVDEWLRSFNPNSRIKQITRI